MRDDLGFLSGVDIFSSLSEGELQQLLARATVRELTADTPVIVQGETGCSLFIVKDGALNVFLNEGGDDLPVGTLTTGDFFGEMSLLTGAPRSATVTPSMATTVFEITKAALEPFMHAHEDLAGHMSRTLSNRQVSNLKTVMEFERPIERQERETLAARMSFRIRSFFDLPTTIWGKAVGGLAGFSLKGPLGEAVCDETSGDEASDDGSDDGDKQLAFTTAVIVLVAKMATAGGSYGRRETDRLQKIFSIHASEMANVRRIYDRAQGNVGGFEPYAGQIAQMFKDEPAVLEELIGSLLDIAGADGQIHPNQETFIRNIGDLFGFDNAVYERLQTLHRNSQGGAAVSDAVDCLKILKVSQDASAAEVKIAHRKLVMENHPDKLIAQGMPAEFIEQANKKLAAINNAYDQFRTVQGIA